MRRAEARDGFIGVAEHYERMADSLEARRGDVPPYNSH
jgi:hypothetical protein